MLSLCSIQTPDGLQLYGTLHKATNPKKPLIIIAHGYFSSNRIGPHRLYYMIAERLKEAGYNVVRFDLRAMGESDGKIEDARFNDHVSDLMVVIKSFRQRFNDSPIILVAHCIGCNVSLPFIEMCPSYFERVIYISPYFTTKRTLDAVFSAEQQEELKMKGHTYRKGLYSDATFFTGRNDFEAFVESVRRYSKLITVISARNDQFIPFNDIDRFYEETAMTPIIIPAADHNYLDGEARKKLIRCICEIVEGEKTDDESG